MIGFIVGMVVGGCLGYLTAALMVAASRGSDSIGYDEWSSAIRNPSRRKEWIERAVREWKEDQ